MKRQNLLWIAFVSMIILLTACQEELVDTEIYDYLEATATAEDSLQDVREKMAHLEEEENELYKELIDQPLSQPELLEEHLNKATELIDKRQQLLAEEQEAMELSKEQFIQTEPLLEQIDNDTAQESAEKMYEIMTERYDIYNDWYQAYVHRLEKEEQLYDLFREDTIDFEKINEQVEIVNATYDEAKIILDQFSEQTTLYNQAKIDYYEKSELNITFD